MSSRVQYQEVQCRNALSRVEGMGFRWSLNPYRGCVHGCHYCFARRYHLYYDLNADEDFTSIILAKVNISQVLREELSRPSWRWETVAMGTATDPYQPIEGKYRLTRRCLEVFAEKHSPVSLVTKGTMAVRDIDVLGELARRAGCTVCFSVTTLDVDLWRRLEPGTPPPHKRLLAMERLVGAGVEAGVLLAPVIPGITDTQENLEDVVREAAFRGARFLGANVLYLKEGTREHFLGFLQQEYPGLLQAYQRLYPRGFAPKRFQEQVHQRVDLLKTAFGLKNSGDSLSGSAGPPQQLTLALR